MQSRLKKIRVHILKKIISLKYISAFLLTNFTSFLLTKIDVDIRKKFSNKSLQKFVVLNKTSKKFTFLNLVEKNINDLTTVYPTSNDVLDISVLKNRTRPSVFLGIANLTSLDILANMSAESIFFTDINKHQLGYIDTVIDIVKKSETRYSFLGNFYHKDSKSIQKLLQTQQYTSSIELEDRFWSIKTVTPAIESRGLDSLKLYSPINKKAKNIGVVHELLGKNVLGGIKVLNTLTETGTEIIDDITYHKFPMIKDGGFLSNDKLYDNLRNTLLKKEFHLIESPLSADLLLTVFSHFRYYTIICWTSNISNWYFWDKSITTLYNTSIALKYYYRIYSDLIILSDERDPFLNNLQAKLPKRKPDAHWLAFREVQQLLMTNNIEIVNVEYWMTTKSTLTNTEKILLKNLTSDLYENSDCIFLHGLYSHGLELNEYKKITKNLIETGKRIVLLEFNKHSIEIAANMQSLTFDGIKELFGEPDLLKFVSGERSSDRNLIAVFNS